MTVAELAKRAGVSDVAVWTWEHRGRIPRSRTLDAVAKALGVSRNTLSASFARRQESDRNSSRPFSHRSSLSEKEMERLSLEALMRAIDAKGFKVLVEPKKKVA